MAKNDVPGALKAIESGISANPSYTHGYVTRGVVLGVMKRWPESLKSLERGMAEHPNDIDGLIALAAAQANLRKVKEARATITRAIRLAPKHPLAQRVYLQLHPQR
jgi:tetratricopeptide (TPR) repeat protein